MLMLGPSSDLKSKEFCDKKENDFHRAQKVGQLCSNLRLEIAPHHERRGPLILITNLD